MASALGALDPDLIYLQEVDRGSDRSYGTRQTASYDAVLPGRETVFANNFKTLFVPYPLPPIGRVDSGVYTLSKADIAEAERIQLPCPFSWPIRLANLKRCMLVTRYDLEGTDRELVVVNFHLEAYDDGEGKLAQSKQLREFVEKEFAAGNYVIAGGDWNQIFPEAESAYPNTHTELWTPGYLDPAELGEGWAYVTDLSEPTCRLLNQPYKPDDAANTQYYVIDGFLVSPNVKVQSVQTLDEGFTYSDHNPVLLTVSLGE
jgi:endonuclease/exonuclease/phosphatase family metal-dependent hydrolase